MIRRVDLRQDEAFFTLLVDSHRRLIGSPLGVNLGLPPCSAAWLYAEAPYCVLAHDAGDDPHFTYANCAAQACFGYAWEEFVGLPSRLSAAPLDQNERQRLLDAVAAHGFITDYHGQRVARSGRRFWITATVWNLVDGGGRKAGQAASFAVPN